MQLAEVDKNHLDFLKIFALVELLFSPSHQFFSFNFYKKDISQYNLKDIEIFYHQAEEHYQADSGSCCVIDIDVHNVVKKAPPYCYKLSALNFQSKESFYTCCDDL